MKVIDKSGPREVLFGSLNVGDCFVTAQPPFATGVWMKTETQYAVRLTDKEPDDDTGSLAAGNGSPFGTHVVVRPVTCELVVFP